ncbi:MAG: hypothetical protein RL494_1288 [Bacteroidota bacterium]
MKLLLITSIQEFENDIKQILKKASVKSFSYKYVKGFKDNSADVLESNWFGSAVQENESVLFYAFVPIENVNIVFDLTEKFNEKQETISHIHIAVLNIEKSN